MSDSTIIRPLTDDINDWKAYWNDHGEPWRTEPEIAPDRQQELAVRRDTIQPNIEQGIYPFRNIPLSRADIEWMLHEHGPIDWENETQRGRAGMDLRGALLQGLKLQRLPLDNIQGGLTFDEFWNRAPNVIEAASVHLENANLEHTSLKGAILLGAHLEQANFRSTKLQRATLYNAHLEGTFFSSANMAGTNLRRAILDARTNFYKVITADSFYGQVSLRDVQWNGADITVLDWQSLPYLGDERRARERRRVRDFENAARANHQVATVMRSQGLGQYADRFAYRARLWQRAVAWRQHRIIAAIGSWFLDMLAGYGYKPGRTLLIYLITIIGFAFFYFSLLAPLSGIVLSPLGAIVLSISSFHGRGFFPGSNISLDAPITVAAAGEAIVGLLIEISFIATFTQRFFGR